MSMTFVFLNKQTNKQQTNKQTNNINTSAFNKICVYTSPTSRHDIHIYTCMCQILQFIVSFIIQTTHLIQK